MDNTDLPLKRLPDAEVWRRLDNVQVLLLNESFGGDDEARCELMEERHLLFQELKRRESLSPPSRTKKLQPKPNPLCKHTKCGNPAHTIDCPDDHDSNAGMYYVKDYCSLQCFVCDLKHAWDKEDSDRLLEVFGRIGD